MTKKELTLLEAMQKLENKTIKQKDVAKVLSLCIRQTKRLYKNFKILGAKGLVSKKRLHRDL